MQPDPNLASRILNELGLEQVDYPDEPTSCAAVYLSINVDAYLSGATPFAYIGSTQPVSGFGSLRAKLSWYRGSRRRSSSEIYNGNSFSVPIDIVDKSDRWLAEKSWLVQTRAPADPRYFNTRYSCGGLSSEGAKALNAKFSSEERNKIAKTRWDNLPEEKKERFFTNSRKKLTSERRSEILRKAWSNTPNEKHRERGRRISASLQKTDLKIRAAKTVSSMTSEQRKQRTATGHVNRQRRIETIKLRIAQLGNIPEELRSHEPKGHSRRRPASWRDYFSILEGSITSASDSIRSSTSCIPARIFSVPTTV